MLEKQKEWCQNKVEKGKKWIKDHQLEIGYGLGVAATIGGGLLIDKIFEPRKKIGQIYRGDFENKDGVIDFGIGITEVDRFGKEHVTSDKILLLDEKSKDLLFKNVEAAIAETKALREKAE